MSLAVVYSRAQFGMEAPLVSVEVHLAKGLPRFTMVGLPETVVRESKDRVRSALLNSHFSFPNQRITINLAPAELPKEGGRFDLPIAIGILLASGQLSNASNYSQYELAGELSLSGELKPFAGILPFILQAKKEKKISIIPHSSISHIGPVSIGEVYSAQHLTEVCLHLKQELKLPMVMTAAPEVQATTHQGDLSDIKGQPLAKRALEVAAAGGHNLLLVGPPGSGKTLLASRLPSILPLLSEPEAIEVSTLMGIRGYCIQPGAFFTPPFRGPHHSASSVALVGGGSKVFPGEVSLAHRGVLFLDELPEFNRSALEVLREPIESGMITIARASNVLTYPAEFQLVAAMNPCPCGYSGSRGKSCECSHQQIQRYRHKLSGPLLDRFDLSIFVNDLTPTELFSNSSSGEGSDQVRTRVVCARKIQQERTACLNQRLNRGHMTNFCSLKSEVQSFLVQVMEKRKCSARSFNRIIRVARTIADLAHSAQIQIEHLSEVLQMRYFDREIPG